MKREGLTPLPLRAPDQLLDRTVKFAGTVPVVTPIPLHQRTYSVDAFDEGEGRLRLRGHLRDERPSGLVPGDPDPLVVHDMTVDLIVQLPAFEIISCQPVMDVRPNWDCTGILEHYQAVVGLSITRGFTHKVRELFGGPRGCSHLSILLQAMAPVAIQAMFSLPRPGRAGLDPASLTPEQMKEIRRTSFEFNRNTCHVFADDGPMWEKVEGDEMMEPPIWAKERLAKLGLTADDWFFGRHQKADR